jgi:paraquat-inducible protein B
MPGGMDGMVASVRNILDKIERIDIEGIGADLRGTLKGTNAIANAPHMDKALADLAASLASTRVILQKLEQRAEPLAANLEQALAASRDAMEKATATMKLLEDMLAPDAPTRESAQRALREVGETARSIRNFVDLLQRQPSSVIFGKQPAGEK